MAKINKHIEIVRSSQASLNSMGKKSCDMIRSVLERHYERVGITLVNDIQDLEALVAKQPDLVFLGLKRLENVWVSAFLDDNGIDYTGSTAAAIALDFNKHTAKQVVKAAGLNTATYFLASPGQYPSASELPIDFPLFIKPPNTGGGKGIDEDSVARDFAGYARKVQSIANDFQTDALVEAYLPGREFSVAILETSDSEQLITMPIELVADHNDRGDRILGQKIKAADTEHVSIIRDDAIKQVVTELAVSVFKVLGARDYGRIDIRLDAHGSPHFLEANLIPGVARHDFTSYFTSACWLIRGLDYEAMILSIVELGLARNLYLDEPMFELSTAANTLLTSLNPAFEIV